MNKVFALISTIFLFVVSSIKSQGLTFRTINNANGLSQNSVYDLVQSKDGYIWAGTIDGLNRFDGRLVKTFYPAADSFSSNTIRSLLIDNNELIWVGTESELLIFNPDNWTFNLPSNHFPGFEDSAMVNVQSILKDKVGDYYFLTASQGIFKYSSRNQKFSLLLGGDDFINIIETESGQLYLASSTKLYQVLENQIQEVTISNRPAEGAKISTIGANGNGVLIAFYDHGIYNLNIHKTQADIKLTKVNLPKIPDDVEHIFCTKNASLYLGSRSAGLCKISIENQELIKATKGSSVYDLKSNFILSILEDKDGHIWVGTSGGGLAYNYDQSALFQRFQPSELSTNKSGDDMIFGIHQHNEDTYYMGSLNGGLKEFDNIKNQITYHNDATLPAETQNIYSIIEEHGILWMATWGGVCSYDIKTEKWRYFSHDEAYASKLYSIVKVDDKRFLIGGENGLGYFYPLTGRYGKIYTSPLNARYISRLNEKQFLVASGNMNLVLYDASDSSIFNYSAFTDISTDARHIYIDGEVIWVATNYGIIQIDKSSMEVIKHWTTKDGLANNFIYAINKDFANYIWCSSNQGLSRIDPVKKSIVNYGLDFNLQNLEFNTSSTFRNDQNQLMFGGIQGWNSINATSTVNSVDISPPNVIDVRVDNQSIIETQYNPKASVIQLRNNQREFTIGFSSIEEFKTPSLQYAYKLNELGWVQVGPNGNLNFTDFRSGEHHLVLGAFANGNLSDINAVKHVTLKVDPYLWERAWFRILSILAILGAILWLNRGYVKRLKAKHIYEKRITELELLGLRTQMNPHFIFNTMNSIRQYAIYKSRDETSDFIVAFASLIRGILENSKKLEVKLSRELEMLDNYIAIEQRRLDHAITYQKYIDPRINTEETMIPSMIIQPFIENAIWHGLQNAPGDKILQLRIIKTEIGFNCEIIDNGVGREKSHQSKSLNKKSLGTKITKERLDRINSFHNTDNNIIYEDLYNQEGQANGTKAIIKIRYPEKYADH